MANIDTTSFTNTSVVSGIGLTTSFQLPSSVVNSSIVSDVIGKVVTSLTSVNNTSVVSDVGLAIGINLSSTTNASTISGINTYAVLRVNSVVATNTIGPISFVPDAIGLIEISNNSSVGQLFVFDVATPIEISQNSIVNQSGIGKLLLFSESLVQETILPVTRPRTSISSATTGLRKFVFRDLAMKGGSHPLTGDILTVTDAHAIGQSIRNIVMTMPTERFFDFIDFGVGIEKYLFAIHDLGLKGRLTDEILEQLALYEPRAIINSVETSGEAYQHQLEIDITYTVKTTQVTNTITILLERR